MMALDPRLFTTCPTCLKPMARRYPHDHSNDPVEHNAPPVKPRSEVRESIRERYGDKEDI